MDLDLSRPELPSNYTFYTESASVGIFLVFGLIANVPLVFIYVRSKHIRSVADKFLFNILITDVLSLFILLPTIIMDLILNHREESTSSEELMRETTPSVDFPSTWSCTFKKSFLSGVATASILAALEIAVERYLVIVTPLHYHKLLTRTAVVTTSIIGVFIAMGSAVLSSLDPCEPVFPSCAKTTITYTESFWWPTYTLIHVSVFFILPVILMAYIYLRIWCEARRQLAKINEQCKNPFFLSDHQQISEHVEKGKRRIFLYPSVIRTKIMNRLNATRMDKAARASIFTLGATIICWSPYYYVQCAHAIRSILEQLGGNFKVLEAWNHWETTLPLLFASLHPVLETFFYAYRYKRLREEVIKILRLDILLRCFFSPRRRLPENHPIEKSPHLSKVYAPPDHNPVCKISQRICTTPAPETVTRLLPEERPRFHIGDATNDSVQDEDTNFSPDLGMTNHALIQTNSNAMLIQIQTVPEKSPENGGDFAANLDKKMTDTIGLKATFYWIGSTSRHFLHYVSEWAEAYSKRWRNQRESVTSTSSVVTLLSTRWCPEMPEIHAV